MEPGTSDPADPSPSASFDPPPFSASAQGYDLTFFTAGHDRLTALLALIDGARASLRLCFYIFADDDSGRQVVAALTAAVRRGVEVSLIVDGFGSSATPEALFAPLWHAGARFCRFSPRRTIRYLIRNHQKIAIADGAVALIGGFNVEDSYFAPPEQDGWHDLAVRVEGPAVARLADWFDGLLAWTLDPHAQWRAIRRLLREWDPGDGPVQWLLGGPTAGLSSWARCVSEDLRRGRRLDMIMAYFSPGARLLARIGRIGRHGDANLVLAARSDNGATIGASRLLYGSLLKRKARIWEFEPSKLHTKLIVLDDAVYLGSANFDMRSLFINLELMLRIEDAVLAERLRGYVRQHLPACQQITRELHQSRLTLLNRLRWTLSWFIVAVVDYTVTRRLNFGQ